MIGNGPLNSENITGLLEELPGGREQRTRPSTAGTTGCGSTGA